MSEASLSRRTIRQWQEMFRSIYGTRNRMRSSAERILLQLQIELSCLAERVRKDKPDKLQSLTGIGARIFALANWFDLDLEVLVAAKYPGRCPYCGKEADCSCLDASRTSAIALAQIEESHIALDEFQDVLQRIYGKSNQEQGRSRVFNHLNEELGELTAAILDGDEKGLREEIADLFAWWIGYASLQEVMSMSHLLYQFYPDACSRCNQRPCPSDGPCPPL